jgi:hypothetical protein
LCGRDEDEDEDVTIGEAKLTLIKRVPSPGFAEAGSRRTMGFF